MSTPQLPPSRRSSRILQGLGLRGTLLLERLDGEPVTDADVEAARRAFTELDELEARAERHLGLSGKRPTRRP